MLGILSNIFHFLDNCILYQLSIQRRLLLAYYVQRVVAFYVPIFIPRIEAIHVLGNTGNSFYRSEYKGLTKVLRIRTDDFDYQIVEMFSNFLIAVSIVYAAWVLLL